MGGHPFEEFILTLLQTRQKIKEAYAAEFAATIERAEKQIILARHGRRLLNLLDDTPVVPGDVRPAFEHTNQARQVLNDAEDDLREWQPELEDVESSSHLINNNLMPSSSVTEHSAGAIEGETAEGYALGSAAGTEGSHLAHHHDEVSHGTSGTSVTTGPTYAVSETEGSQLA